METTLSRRFLAGCAFLLLSAFVSGAEKPMMTRWGEKVTAENAWREYPRPQLVRENWTCLNGHWDYVITDVTNTFSRPKVWAGKILVPFAIEAPLSGVGRLLEPTEFLWYTRKISVTKPKDGARILLHFDGVDYRASVFIGHQEVLDVPHEGAQEPFTIDITDYVKDGDNELTVCVWDPTDGPVNSHGKQCLKPSGCFYTRVSGIWQSVWLETVPRIYVRDYTVVPDIDSHTATFVFDAPSARMGEKVSVEVVAGDKVIVSKTGVVAEPLVVSMPADAKLWSPETPHLYSFRARLEQDAFTGYFAMRKFSKAKDAKGVLRFFLNNRPYFILGTLDQGWWPDGLLTPPSEEAMAHDIQTLKDCGFNMMRKHIKVEPRRYYALCDRLGLLVLQDLPSTAIHTFGPSMARSPYFANHANWYGMQRYELKAMIDNLRKVPSIVMWIPYNEGWGQPGPFLTHVTLDWVKRYDPSRLVNAPSGWCDFEGGSPIPNCHPDWKVPHLPEGVCEAADVVDQHCYRGPEMPPVNARRISFLGEFGGLGHAVSNHLWKAAKSWGYGGMKDTDTREGLQKTYLGLMEKLVPLAAAGLAGSVYTQTTDVEIEINGIMTYDRAVLKYDPAVLRKAHERVKRAGEGDLTSAAAPVPPAPGPESWTFRQELARELPYHARKAYHLQDDYGLKGNLETVKADLARFFESAPKTTEPMSRLVLKRGRVSGSESYRLDVASSGDVTLTAEDDDGLRRGVCYFEDRISAGDLVSVTRKPWLRHRISRCYFSPIKRPPFNRDELMDDIDYYPDAYLNRLAHEGVNGLWLTVELRNLVQTRYNQRDPDAPKRLEKLRKTVVKCLRYGIRTWIFFIEPRMLKAGDPLWKACPALAASQAPWGEGRVMCPSTPEAQAYLEDALRDLFTQVPLLPGVLNISHGERSTTCLSCIDCVAYKGVRCPRCAKLKPWQIHAQTTAAMVKGMRSVNPKAEMLSWFYQPYVEFERDSWVADVARHLPDGVTMLYNFESGAIKQQLGRYRPGGDYWLSYVGPAPAFSQIAAASRDVQGHIGAKIQVGCSHECATVPFVSVPGLLWRKYRAMRQARCDVVMQCWYFGNYPGIMNKAAGELAFDNFTADESTFLRHLARPEWGDDADRMARVWEGLSNAYADYPLSNDTQYYGPFHAGVAWPLLPDIEMKALGRTWKPQDPPSGDALGDSLENHTLDEAFLLAESMVCKAQKAMPDSLFADLQRKYAGNAERIRDLGVMRALCLLFESSRDIYGFYRARRQAVSASRFLQNKALALAALGEMRAFVLREKEVTSAMLPLAKADSRLGFHSEAEQHQFYPAKLVWRLSELDRALARLDEIDGLLRAGRVYPLSEHEKSAPALKVGVWQALTKEGLRLRHAWTPLGDLVIEGEVPASYRNLDLSFFDVCGTAWAKLVTLRANGTFDVERRGNIVTPPMSVRSFNAHPRRNAWSFELTLDAGTWQRDCAQRPGWISVRKNGGEVWPAKVVAKDARLNIGSYLPEGYGRLE